MSTSVDTMKNFFNVLKLYANDTTTDGVAILDHAVKTVSHFAGLQDAVNHFIYDIASVTASTGNPWQSLYQNCGIVVGADYDFSVDTGSASGYNAGMGIVKNAQDIVPEDNVILSELPLPAAASSSTHTYTGADGNTFTYTVNYPLQYLEVVDVSTAQKSAGGSLDYSNVQTTYLQAGITYNSVTSDGRVVYSALGEQVAPAMLNMLRGLENYWLDGAFKLAYDSFGLDFNGKMLNIMFGINVPYDADTTPTEYTDLEAVFPVDSINMYLDSVYRSSLDPSDTNGKAYSASGNIRMYVDRLIAHEMIHAVMFAAGLFKDNMPEFFTEGVAELNQGVDDYNGTRTTRLLALADDSERLTNALAFEAGTGTADAYPAGHMFLRYLLHQSLPTQVAIGTGTTPELFAYTGGEEILSGAATGSQVNLASNIGFTATTASGDDLIVSTTTGNLIVRDARGKLLNFANESGTVVSRSYMADAAGTVDGRGLSGYEFIAGANNVNNALIAGDGGAQLWGGVYGNDELFGGNGADVFVAGVACGNDTIYNAASNDIINLSATLDQITGTNVTSSGVALNFSDGSTLAVAGTVGATFALTDGSTFVADQTSGQFTRTN